MIIFLSRTIMSLSNWRCRKTNEWHDYSSLTCTHYCQKKKNLMRIPWGLTRFFDVPETFNWETFFSMSYVLVLFISILPLISTRILPSKTLPEHSIFTYKHTPNFLFDHNRKRLHWFDLFFISFLIFLFLLLLFCLYYKQWIMHTLGLRTTIQKSNQPMTIVHSTTDPLIDQSKSMYLTVPQPSYVHH